MYTASAIAAYKMRVLTPPLLLPPMFKLPTVNVLELSPPDTAGPLAPPLTGMVPLLVNPFGVITNIPLQ